MRAMAVRLTGRETDRLPLPPLGRRGAAAEEATGRRRGREDRENRTFALLHLRDRAIHIPGGSKTHNRPQCGLPIVQFATPVAAYRTTPPESPRHRAIRTPDRQAGTAAVARYPHDAAATSSRTPASSSRSSRTASAPRASLPPIRPPAPTPRAPAPAALPVLQRSVPRRDDTARPGSTGRDRACAGIRRWRAPARHSCRCSASASGTPPAARARSRPPAASNRGSRPFPDTSRTPSVP
jgi:hypothetical protein